ncbi:MAG: hypothetical protein ABW215_20935 [Kibdelosporangium sp.]
MIRASMTARPNARDDTTRYLCAAAQLDSKFADDAIREFLVEPTRPVPPSPGTDTTAVLGEAIAARTRRKYRDSALLALAVVVLFTAPVDVLLGWLVLGLLASLPQWLSRRKLLASKTKVNPAVMLAGGVAVAVLVVVGPQLFEYLSDSTSTSRSSRSRSAAAEESTGALVAAIVMIAGMLAVLLTDRLIVWRHLTTRFNRLSPPVADPLTSERPVLTASTGFLHELHRVAATERGQAAREGAPLIVYRGYSPFVGAGFEYRPWSMAVPLQPIKDKQQAELTTDLLYGSIREALAGLGRATPLTPGRRLGDLRITDQVIVPAGELVDHLADPATRTILADLDEPPYPVMGPENVAHLRATPEEWARYYLCFQVETWDRDLVVSVFVHVAMDETTMYVEWTPCVLLPIKDEYQDIDRLPPGPLRPVLNAVARLVRLPATILQSTAHTFSTIRPAPRRPGMVDPEMYGSLRSLREMAADDGVRNYFQLVDVERYLKILNSRFVLAVSKLLRDSGYSAAGFEQQAVTVNNRNVHIGGSVYGDFQQGDNSTFNSPDKPGEEK